MSDKPDSGSPASEYERLESAARNVGAHWDEFGPGHGFDEAMDQLYRALTSLSTAPAQPPGDPAEQPVADFADAYQGARDDLLIWKRRALEAEELNRKFSESINGIAFMGEPVRTMRPAAHSPAALPEGWLQDAEKKARALRAAAFAYGFCEDGGKLAELCAEQNEALYALLAHLKRAVP